MPTEELPILNLSVPLHKKLLIERIKTLQGIYRIELTRCKDQRSLQQNSYLWGVVYPAICPTLSECEGQDIDPMTAHDFFKERFLRRPIVNKDTGEVLGGAARSSTKLDVEEFSVFLQKVIQFAQEKLGVTVPPATHYYQEATA